eukprot:COSAG02_NODE_25385_length_660_cov_1.008913_1_plen_80_part_01
MGKGATHFAAGKYRGTRAGDDLDEYLDEFPTDGGGAGGSTAAGGGERRSSLDDGDLRIDLEVRMFALSVEDNRVASGVT